MSVGRALDDATFDEFIRSADRPVLVDFWAPWCRPCLVLDPILASVAASDDRFRLASVDVDVSPSLARRFEVMSAPTLVLLDDASVVWRSVGSRGRARLVEELDRLLAPQPAR